VLPQRLGLPLSFVAFLRGLTSRHCSDAQWIFDNFARASRKEKPLLSSKRKEGTDPEGRARKGKISPA